MPECRVILKITKAAIADQANTMTAHFGKKLFYTSSIFLIHINDYIW